MNKIILDTDIGDDIDDAFALSILLNEKNADLLGVTTVFRNSYKRAKMASYLIKTFGKDVKVYAGCDEPLIAKVETLLSPEIKEKEKLDENGKYLIPQYSNEMDEGVVEKQHAVDFIIEQVHKYPNEITLVGIGPLTNIALAIRKDPSICSLLKEIRIMGGDPTNVNCKEWNIFCDPEAARIVYEAARMDGANRWHRIIHITIPSIAPTIVLFFILSLSGILNNGFDHIWTFQNQINLDTSEVLDTFIYKNGIIHQQYSYTTAVGVFKSVIAIILLVVGNKICKKVTGNGVI